jgi:hypothetical protein
MLSTCSSNSKSYQDLEDWSVPHEESVDRRDRTIFRGLDRREQFPSIEYCDVFTFATLLDPRYKRHGFNSSLKAGFAVEGLRKILSKVNLHSNSSVEEPHTANATQEPQSSCTSASDDWDIFMGVDDPEIDVQIGEQDDE